LLTHKDGEKEEGWGTVFLEAAAAGLPVVAGRSGGAKEAVIHGETGYVVDVYQDASVVAGIANLLTDKALAAQYGSKGKERALREFKWPVQINKLA
jgi:phosphatidylinositol alpha-1,6-mannosyltransferase